MRILFVAPLPEPVTGQSVACQVLLGHLAKHYHVDVVNLSKRGLAQRRYSIGRVIAVFRIVLDVWRLQRSADAIYLTVSESYFGNLKDLLIYLVCFRKLEKMVIHLYGGAGLRGIMLTDGHPLRKPNELFLRRLGGAIVEGRRQMPTFANVLPVEKVHVVPNFAEDFLFSDAASINRKFEDTRPLRILFLSNLLPGKGHEELVEAYRSLDEHAKASVVIDVAGGFDSEQEKRLFLSRIDCLPQIRYHGSVRGERKKELFHRAHVFCLPTYYAYEGQPLSILEAYASGCAVITTDHSGIRDVFSHDLNGFEVVKRSPAGLKAAIERATASPGCLRTMALANLAVAEQNYRTEHYRGRMMSIIESME